MRAQEKKSHNQLFDELNPPALKSLPIHPCEYGEWKLDATVPLDYYTTRSGHYSSVPPHLISRRVNFRVTVNTISVFHGNSRTPVAYHLLNNAPGGRMTQLGHRPSAHRFDADEQITVLLNCVSSTCVTIPHPGLTPSGGCPLFRWVETSHAADVHDALARSDILVRVFNAPTSIRFGLPGAKRDWLRLERSLKCLQSAQS